MRINPAFYVNITEKCNMRCRYCALYGENWEPTETPLKLDQLLIILTAAVEAGFETFQISGGEPMLYPTRVLSVIRHLNKLGKEDIILNTNGFNLGAYANEIDSLRINKVKISLDSATKEIFEAITGSGLFDRVMKSIQAAAKSAFVTELNLVLMRSNADAIWGLIELCEKHQISLKVLDLVEYDVLVSDVPDSAQFWRDNYLDPVSLVPILAERFGPPTTVHLSSGRGIPMLQFASGDRVTVTLKPSSAGSTFGSICPTCTHYPCQEGLFHVSLSAEGNLTPCRLRRDLTIPLAIMGYDGILAELVCARSPFERAFFVEETRQFPTGRVPACA